MKLLKALALAAVLGCAASITSFAQIITDTWTAAGGAWIAANQTAPDFDLTTGGGILKSDQQIGGATGGSTLSVSGLVAVGGPASQLIDSDLYTGSATPVTFSLATTEVLEGVRYIQLIAGYAGGGTLAENSIIINFGANVVSQSYLPIVYLENPDGRGDRLAAVWTWEVDITDTSTPLEFSWKFFAPHTSVAVVSLTQSVDVIPEPSTFGLVGAGLLLSGFMATRRRRLTK